jgi:hypothetical protein
MRSGVRRAALRRPIAYNQPVMRLETATSYSLHRITGLGTHSVPVRERSGAKGSPRATEPGSGAEPRSGKTCEAG